jgi:hypothetical protein
MALETDAEIDGMYLSADEPTRSVRPAILESGRRGLLIGGDGHRTGTGPPEASHYDALQAWAAERWPGAPVIARWSSQDHSTFDGVPFVGRQPRHERLYVATGFSKWGMTNGSAAALMLADAIDGRGNPWAFAFDAGRIGNAHTLAVTARENVKTIGGYWMGGQARRIVSSDRSPTCTHMGCKMRRNEAERSWDCPCHGSRFAPDGTRIEGVATRDLPSSPGA